MRGGTRVPAMVAAAIMTVAVAAGPARAELSASRLASAAEAAYKAKHYVRALMYAEDGLEAPRRTAKLETRLHTIATMAACQLKDAAKARAHAGKLDGPRRTLTGKVCKANGVTLDE